MAFCLLPEKVDAFKQALKEKEISISDLLNMSTEDRTEMLRPYAGDNAEDVNALFEQKLVLKNKMMGIKNWASKLGEIGKYSPEGKASALKAAEEWQQQKTERILSPQEDQAFLGSLAEKAVGVEIPREVAAKVFEMTKKLDDLKTRDAKMSGVSDEYLIAKKELNQYVASFKKTSLPASIVQNLAVIGRNNLLLNPATPIKTTINQTVNTIGDAIVKRFSYLSMNGDNADLAKQAQAEAWATFRKTGANTAQMESLDDIHLLGKGENFNPPTGAESKPGFLSKLESGIRKVAGFSNKVAIDLEHNVTFTKFYQKAFFGMADFAATDVAKRTGGDSAAIFTDAARIEPQTKEGAMVRQLAQQAAARVTSTNETIASRFAMGSKNMLNKIIPGVPLGDFIIPMAKIPASVIWNGIENAGAGLPSGVMDFFEGRKKMQSTDLQTRYEGMNQFASGVQMLARIAGTLGVSALLTSQLQKEDFRTDPYGNHFVKIGNIWVNTEYIAAISPSMAGFMSAKENGTGVGSDVVQYGAGAAQGLKSLPGVDEVSTLLTTNFGKYARDFFTSRGAPAFLQNLMKNKPIDRLFFGATGVETTEQVREDAQARAQKSAAARNSKLK